MVNDSTSRLISWTLAGAGTDAIIGDALRSAEGVADESLVIFTPPTVGPFGATVDTDKATLILQAAHMAVARERLRFAYWPWCNDFAAARNAALTFATEAGATWGLMLDSDERILCPDPAALRAYLAALPPEVEMVLVHHHDGSHTRERIFRLPCPRRFVGRTHETIVGAKVLAPRDLIQWWERPKSREQLDAKWARDLEMLRADLVDDPTNGAAHYYLGETLQSLGRHEEAIAAFREHNRLSTWEEIRAWACFKAAESYHALGQPYRVLECAAQGLVHDAGMAELYWIAATACLAEAAKLADEKRDPHRAWEWVEQARCWGETARVHGAGSKAEARRWGPRDVRGLGPGVDEVLCMVESLGEPGRGP